MDKFMSCFNRNNFTSSLRGCLGIFYFSCLVPLGRNSFPMVTRSDRSSHLSLEFMILQKMFSDFIKKDVTYGFFMTSI